MAGEGAGRRAILVLHAAEHAAAAAELAGALATAGHAAERHALSSAAVESDRAALPELDDALAGLAARTGTSREEAVVVGLGRGGTLAFLVGCVRRVAAVVDVDGPVLHAELSPGRPTQPLELALNLEGAFLGLFSGRGLFSGGVPVGADERQLLSSRLVAAARPHALVPFPDPAGGPSREAVGSAHEGGYHGAAVTEVARRVLAFLSAALPEDG